MATDRLDKYYLTQLVLDAEEATLQLRTHPDGTGPGYDVEIHKAKPRVRLQSVNDKNGGPIPHEVSDEDAATILALHAKLIERSTDLLGYRRALLEVRVDGQPLGPAARPSQVVERLVAAIAPTVNEIARHSSSPDELVLKRVLADDRREEIFVSRADLSKKLEPLPATSLGLFAPLKLVPQGHTRAPSPSPASAPSPALVTRAGTIDGNDLVTFIDPKGKGEKSDKNEAKRPESPVIVIEEER